MQSSLLATELTVNCIVQSPSLSLSITMRQSSIQVGIDGWAHQKYTQSMCAFPHLTKNNISGSRAPLATAV